MNKFALFVILFIAIAFAQNGGNGGNNGFCPTNPDPCLDRNCMLLTFAPPKPRCPSTCVTVANCPVPNPGKKICSYECAPVLLNGVSVANNPDGTPMNFCKAVDCNDNNPCTQDACGLTPGTCSNIPFAPAQCVKKQMCKWDVTLGCVPNSCQTAADCPVKPPNVNINNGKINYCAQRCAPRYQNGIPSIDNFCLDYNCNDGDVCTMDSCSIDTTNPLAPVGTCINTPVPITSCSALPQCAYDPNAQTCFACVPPTPNNGNNNGNGNNNNNNGNRNQGLCPRTCDALRPCTGALPAGQCWQCAPLSVTQNDGTTYTTLSSAGGTSATYCLAVAC